MRSGSSVTEHITSSQLYDEIYFRKTNLLHHSKHIHVWCAVFQLVSLVDLFFTKYVFVSSFKYDMYHKKILPWKPKLRIIKFQQFRFSRCWKKKCIYCDKANVTKVIKNTKNINDNTLFVFWTIWITACLICDLPVFFQYLIVPRLKSFICVLLDLWRNSIVFFTVCSYISELTACILWSQLK